MIDWNQTISAQAKAENAARLARARIKARRDEAIAAGIVVAGLRVATDDTSQQRITGAALAALLDPGYVLQWKTSDGFVTLTGEQVIGLAQAMRSHVQACFDREAELLTALAAGEPVNTDEGWP